MFEVVTETADVPIETIIVDNGSRDETTHCSTVSTTPALSGMNRIYIFFTASTKPQRWHSAGPFSCSTAMRS